MAPKLRVGLSALAVSSISNVRGYRDHPKLKIAALCEADPALLASVARAEYPRPTATGDFQDFLRPARLDRNPHASSAARGDDVGGARRRRPRQRAETDGDGRWRNATA